MGLKPEWALLGTGMRPPESAYRNRNSMKLPITISLHSGQVLEAPCNKALSRQVKSSWQQSPLYSKGNGYSTGALTPHLTFLLPLGVGLSGSGELAREIPLAFCSASGRRDGMLLNERCNSIRVSSEWEQLGQGTMRCLEGGREGAREGKTFHPIASSCTQYKASTN